LTGNSSEADMNAKIGENGMTKKMNDGNSI